MSPLKRSPSFLLANRHGRFEIAGFHYENWLRSQAPRRLLRRGPSKPDPTHARTRAHTLTRSNQQPGDETETRRESRNAKSVIAPPVCAPRTPNGVPWRTQGGGDARDVLLLGGQFYGLTRPSPIIRLVTTQPRCPVASALPAPALHHISHTRDTRRRRRPRR